MKNGAELVDATHVDDGYEADTTYGPPDGMSKHEGTPLMRKYVQRWLQTHTDFSTDTSLMGVAKKLEEKVFDMEERLVCWTRAAWARPQNP